MGLNELIWMAQCCWSSHVFWWKLIFFQVLANHTLGRPGLWSVLVSQVSVWSTKLKVGQPTGPRLKALLWGVLKHSAINRAVCIYSGCARWPKQERCVWFTDVYISTVGTNSKARSQTLDVSLETSPVYLSVSPSTWLFETKSKQTAAERKVSTCVWTKS